MNRLVIGLLLLCSVLPAYSQPLSDDFLDADPRIKLYMAYAEYKMGNHELARRMWLVTEGSGKAEALFNLGNLYAQGISVKQDYYRAIQFYSEAGRLGSRSAAYQLGLLYLFNNDLKDKQRARKWLSIAAVDGDEDAMALLVGLTDAVQDNSPLFEVERLLAQGRIDLAVRTLKKRVLQSPTDTQAATRLAWLYESGLGVERDMERAGELFLSAATAGNAEAQYALSVMLRTGQGIDKDTQQADIWLKRAADAGYPEAVKALESKALEPED